MKFEAGQDFVYGIFDRAESRVIGGIGLHPRVVPGAFEIGYWIRADEIRRGFATEATQAPVSAGLALPDIERIEIHCDPNNARSRRIPGRLGFRLLEEGAATKARPQATPVDSTGVQPHS